MKPIVSFKCHPSYSSQTVSDLVYLKKATTPRCPNYLGCHFFVRAHQKGTLKPKLGFLTNFLDKYYVRPPMSIFHQHFYQSFTQRQNMRSNAMTRPVLKCSNAMTRPVLKCSNAMTRPVLKCSNAMSRPVLKCSNAMTRPVLRLESLRWETELKQYTTELTILPSHYLKCINLHLQKFCCNT